MSDSTVMVPLRELAVDKGLVGGPFGSSLGSKDYEAGGVPVIRGQNLASSGYFDPREFVFVSDEKVDSQLSRNVALPGDVVFTQRGTLGQVGIVPTEPYSRYVISQSQMRMRVDRHLAEPEYVYYCFLDPRMLAKIEAVAITTGVPHINLGILGDLLVPKPPLSVQCAIVQLLKSLDDKIAVNERIVHTALALACQRYAAAIADEAQVGQKRIGEVADVFDGPHATPQKTERGPWFLGIGSLSHGFLDLDSSAHLSDDDFTRWTRRVTPRAGDVLFSYETRLGVASLMPSDVQACLGRRMALMRPIDNLVGSATLLHAYLADEFQETIRKHTIHGATVDRIPLTDLPSWPITLPLPEHRSIIESVLSALHRTIETRQQENRALAKLRDTLLPKLISGELRIRDAERHVADVV